MRSTNRTPTTHYSPITKAMKEGDQLPDVSAKLESGEEIKLAHLGKPLVLFFYPKAFSPVCTAEACHFRDLSAEFAAAGAVVYGVAPDDFDTINRFTAEHKLPFPTISDRDKTLAKMFGAVSFLGTMNRVTVVADATGKVVLHYANLLNPNAHSNRALEVLKSLAS